MNNFQKNLKSTILNVDWLKEHAQSVLDIFPETWTHYHNVSFVQIAFRLKLLGIDFRSDEDFRVLMDALFKVRLIALDDPNLIRRGRLSILKEPK